MNKQMNKYNIKHLVIKPTFACTANCPTCGTRKLLHKSLLGKKTLKVEDWENIFDDAVSLGLERIDISGGEPTLFPGLSDLVNAGKRRNCFVNINTNGSVLTADKATELIKIGLDGVYVSLYSHNPEIHDRMRNKPGLWQSAVNTIRIFSDLQRKFPNFKIKTQTLINKNNYKDIPGLIKLNKELGVAEMAISYLEGDFNHNLLLSVKEIAEFRNKIIKECLAEASDLPKENRTENESALKNLFSNKISDTDWSIGAYQPKNQKIEKCTRPQWFALILANGDVHPCNAVEYTHEPVMGNVLETPFTKIWQSKKFNDFRKNLFFYCEKCPINLYTIIKIK
jgi:radical SAM protein with 4Fe4S-binding SPASM domain